MPDEINATRNRLIQRLRLTAMEYAAIIMSALANLIAALALLFGGVAMYIAVDAKQEANNAKEQNKVYEIYVNNLHAWLTARGMEPPAVPAEPPEDDE